MRTTSNSSNHLHQKESQHLRNSGVCSLPPSTLCPQFSSTETRKKHRSHFHEAWYLPRLLLTVLLVSNNNSRVCRALKCEKPSAGLFRLQIKQLEILHTESDGFKNTNDIRCQPGRIDWEGDRL